MALETKKINTKWTPSRAFVMCFINENGITQVSPTDQKVIDELKSRGIPVITQTTEQILSSWDLTKNDLVVGSFQWTKLAVKKLGIHMPEPPDYPSCLSKFLLRKVWKSTLGQAYDAIKKGLPSKPPFDLSSFFIKPASDVKAFSGGIEPKDSMLGYYLAEWNPQRLSAELPVWCAELVQFTMEYRVYVVYGEIRAICRYRAPQGISAEELYDPNVDTNLDVSIIENAVSILFSSIEGAELSGCSLDFGVIQCEDGTLKTALIEVNEGFSLGVYKGVKPADFTDLLIARWGRLVSSIS